MKVKFKQWDCIAVGSYYTDRVRKAILLIDAETSEPIATATVNMVDEIIPDDEVFIKDYSENEGMADALIKAGIIEPEYIREVPTGYVKVRLYKLTKLALKKFFDE